MLVAKFCQSVMSFATQQIRQLMGFKFGVVFILLERWRCKLADRASSSFSLSCTKASLCKLVSSSVQLFITLQTLSYQPNPLVLHLLTVWHHQLIVSQTIIPTTIAILSDRSTFASLFVSLLGSL